MSIIPSAAPLFVARNSRSASYQIEQSLRFDTNSYMSRTFGSGGNRSTWTFSVWLKICKFDQSDHDIFGGYNSGSRIGLIEHGNGGDVANQFGLDQGGDGTGVYYTDSLYRDPSAWYHLLVTTDYNNATQTDRAEIFVNGERVTATSLSSIAQKDGQIGGAWAHTLGARDGGGTTSNRWNGYMAECHYVDGTHVSDASDFGEYDDNGVWRPIEYTGSHGTVGFYLKFDPSATNGIGHDHSGNGNHWTPTGFTTSGTGTDVMSDTPTNNFCTVNPLAYAYVYYGPNSPQNGNLEVVPRQTYSGNWTNGVGTFPMESGKWYFEVENDGGHSQASIGIFRVSDNTSWPWNQQSSTYHYVYSASNGNKTNTSSSAYGASWSSAGDIVGVAYDGDNGTLTFYKNGTSQGTAFTGLSGTFVARLQIEDNSGAKLICNFGQRDFAYTPPTGFKALSTKNLPAPDIKDGSKYFDTNTWSGNDSTQSFTNSGFQPDLVWVKNRNNTSAHMLFDSVRGVSATSAPGLSSNQTTAEVDYNGTVNNRMLTSLDTSGFSVGADQYGWHVNKSGRTYVGWQWLAGGSGSSNTDGSITSTVSANPTAGFSIVSYTGTGANATIGHGLGVAPKMVIVKSRDTSPSNWLVYHSEANTGNPGYMYLDLTLQNQIDSGNGIWNDTRPTSTVFSVGNYVYTNKLNDDFIAYCFAEVEGYSKFGSYSGGDGVFVYLGFKPSLLILKGTVGTRNWIILDSERSTYNVVDDIIHPNLNNAESVQGSSSVDFVSNGFVTRGGNISGSGDLTVFAAFAENPFGGSGVSPATAR